MASSRLDEEISEKLEACDLFLILVNPDFLASDYCYEQEMERALKCRDERTAIVIPVIVEPCEWQESPLRALKAVPYDGKPISNWDNAYLDIVKEARRVDFTQKIVIEPQCIDHIKEKAKEQMKGYHIKHEFDEIDRENFGRESFNTFREYFEANIADINKENLLQGRFTDNKPYEFRCMLVNNANRTGRTSQSAQKNVFASIGDINFLFSDEDLNSNSVNGAFTVESDDYELNLKPLLFHKFGNEQPLTPQAVAHLLWIQFIDQAGVTCY